MQVPIHDSLLQMLPLISMVELQKSILIQLESVDILSQITQTPRFIYVICWQKIELSETLMFIKTYFDPNKDRLHVSCLIRILFWV